MPLRYTVYRVLSLQLTYIVCCIVWNGSGVVRKWMGLAPLGPAASIWGILLLVVLALLLVTGATQKHWRYIYLFVTLILGVGAVSAIWQAYTGPSELWLSLYWRIAGVVINVVGVVAAALGCAEFFGDSTVRK